MSIPEETINLILERLTAVEKQLADGRGLLEDSRRYFQELRRKEQELLEKELEIERLKRDLYYQKRLCDKEMEDHSRVLEEKVLLLEKDLEFRISQERELFDRRLASEQELWAEKLAGEQEACGRRLAEAKRREGFWARLVRMLTWS
jgi:hypothetical protein